jgi:hypothetical protein
VPPRTVGRGKKPGIWRTQPSVIVVAPALAVNKRPAPQVDGYLLHAIAVVILAFALAYQSQGALCGTSSAALHWRLCF